jgi:MraZ protein
MFRGTTTINLDAKGRLTMPTAYREFVRLQGEGSMVCTIDIKRPCLMLYPLHQWQPIEQKLMVLSDFEPQEAAIKSLILGNANDCEMDKNGRVLLPASLRQFADFDKKLMLVGKVNKFELWDETQWLAQTQENLALVKSIDFNSSARLKDFSL